MLSPSNYATEQLPFWRQRIYNIGVDLEGNSNVLWIAHDKGHEAVHIHIFRNGITQWFLNNHGDQFPTILKHVQGKLPMGASTKDHVDGKQFVIHGSMLPPTGNVLMDALEQRRVEKFRLEAVGLAALLKAAVIKLEQEFTAEFRVYADDYYRQQEGQSNG